MAALPAQAKFLQRDYDAHEAKGGASDAQVGQTMRRGGTSMSQGGASDAQGWDIDVPGWCKRCARLGHRCPRVVQAMRKAGTSMSQGGASDAQGWGKRGTGRRTLLPSTTSGHRASGCSREVARSRGGLPRDLRGAQNDYAAFFAAGSSLNSCSALLRMRSSRGLVLSTAAPGSRMACAVRSTTTSGFTPASLIGLRSGEV